MGQDILCHYKDHESSTANAYAFIYTLTHTLTSDAQHQVQKYLVFSAQKCFNIF